MLVSSPEIEVNGKTSEEPEPRTPFFFLKNDEGAWNEVSEGITAKVLFEDTNRKTTSMLVRMATGSEFPGHSHEGPEELFVLEGDCLCAGELLHVGDYHRAEGGSDHGITKIGIRHLKNLHLRFRRQSRLTPRSQIVFGNALAEKLCFDDQTGSGASSITE